MLYKTAKEESKQAEEHYQIIQKECEELKKSLNEYKEEMVALKKKCEEEERKPLTREERLAFPVCPRVEQSNEKVEEKLKELNAYKFTNQLLLQQLSEERKKLAQCKSAEEVSKMEKEREELKAEVAKMKEKMERMKEVIDKADDGDLEFIDDSSEDDA